MKQLFRNLLILLFFVFINLLTFAQIPVGGVSLIKETGINYQKAGAKGTLTPITITGQPFTSGFKYTTGADMIKNFKLSS